MADTGDGSWAPKDEEMADAEGGHFSQANESIADSEGGHWGQANEDVAPVPSWFKAVLDAAKAQTKEKAAGDTSDQKPKTGGSVASRIMEKYGYKKGQGLGKNEQGIDSPLIFQKTGHGRGNIIRAKDLPKAGIRMAQKRKAEKEVPTPWKSPCVQLNEIQTGLNYETKLTGASNAAMYTMTVKVKGQVFEASARTKKLAKIAVAEEALKFFGIPSNGPYPPWVKDKQPDVPETEPQPKQMKAAVVCPPDIRTKNPIMVLNEMRKGSKFIEEGGSNLTGFVISVEVDGQVFKGMGPSKKVAKTRAAEAAICKIFGLEATDETVTVLVANLRRETSHTKLEQLFWKHHIELTDVQKDAGKPFGYVVLANGDDLAKTVAMTGQTVDGNKIFVEKKRDKDENASKDAPCSRCSRAGHQYEECPQWIEQGRGTCLTCGGIGHLSTACPCAGDDQEMGRAVGNAAAPPVRPPSAKGNQVSVFVGNVGQGMNLMGLKDLFWTSSIEFTDMRKEYNNKYAVVDLADPNDLDKAIALTGKLVNKNKIVVEKMKKMQSKNDPISKPATVMVSLENDVYSEDIKSFFLANFIEVTDVRKKTSFLCAFVDLTYCDDLRKALGLSGHVVCGSRITVEDAELKYLDAIGLRVTVFLGSLPNNITDADIKEFFWQHRIRCTEVRKKQEKRFAHADLANSGDLDRAISLSGSVLMGKEIILEKGTTNMDDRPVGTPCMKEWEDMGGPANLGISMGPKPWRHRKRSPNREDNRSGFIGDNRSDNRSRFTGDNRRDNSRGFTGDHRRDNRSDQMRRGPRPQLDDRITRMREEAREKIQRLGGQLPDNVECYVDSDEEMDEEYALVYMDEEGIHVLDEQACTLGGETSPRTLGGPQTMGGPPQSMGRPPHTMGGFPRSTGGLPQTMDDLPQTMGRIPQSVGHPPETMGHHPPAPMRRGHPQSMGRGPHESVGRGFSESKGHRPPRGWKQR